MVVDFSRTTRTPRRRFANESHVLPVYCLGNWRPLEHTWPYGCIWCFRPAWKPKQPETNGCSTMAIEILYIGNGCLGKHPFVSGCLVSQGLYTLLCGWLTDTCRRLFSTFLLGAGHWRLETKHLHMWIERSPSVTAQSGKRSCSQHGAGREGSASGAPGSYPDRTV